MMTKFIIVLCLKDTTSLKTEPHMIETENSKQKGGILYCHQRNLPRNSLLTIPVCKILKFRRMAAANVKFSASFHLNSKFKFSKRASSRELFLLRNIKQQPCPKDTTTRLSHFLTVGFQPRILST